MQKNVNQDHEIRSLVLNWMKECTIFVLNRVSDWSPWSTSLLKLPLNASYPSPFFASRPLPLSLSTCVYSLSLFDIREFKMPQQQRQWELQKSNRFNRQNNNSAHAACFFVHFFTAFERLRWWKCLVSRFTDLTWMNDDRIFFLCLNLDMIGSDSASE